MKSKFLKKMLVMLLSVIMIASLFPATVFAAGNAYTEATKISFDNDYKGKISDTNTVDWYKFTLASSGTVTITTQANMERIGYSLYYGSKAEKSVFVGADYFNSVLWDSISKVSNKTYEYVLTAGTYYFRVSRYNKFNGDYSFSVSYKDSKESFVESGDGNNNSMETATAVKLNTKYTGCLAYNDKEDFYKFTLSSDSTVNFVTTANMRVMYYYIYDSEGTKLKTLSSYSDSVKKSCSDTFTVDLSKGTYYFVAQNSSSLFDYWGSYTFNISPLKAGWRQSGNSWYYYNKDGSKATGWLNVGGKWYYLDDQGIMRTGWYNDGHNWYYLDNQGVMQTGWIKLSLGWYYLRPTGAMQTGWLQIGNKWYYMNSLGIMVTGWQYIGGKWYYFDNSGAMKTGWLQSGSNWYYLTNSGSMATGWLKVGKDWYYFAESTGIMVTGNRTIGGKTYKFDSNGRWIS